MNKVTDIAVSGKVVITPEIHKIARERNLEAGELHNFIVLYRLIREVMYNTATEIAAKENDRNLVLDTENFNTTYSLYNEINQKFPGYLKVNSLTL